MQDIDRSLENSLFVFAYRGKLYEFNDQQLFFDDESRKTLGVLYTREYLVGQLDGKRVSLLILDLEQDIECYLGANPVPLRERLKERLCEDYFALLSRASQLATWDDHHQYCPRCATELIEHSEDLAKTCTECELTQYPRISPCVIMLVVKGDECLLAHSSTFKNHMFSTLAGFIEAGETAETAVAREVMEEVGVKVKDVTYQFSQSWPFPHSFMLGFTATYDSGEITPDGLEILEAGWFKRDQLPDIPPKLSISRQLIDLFVDGKI